MNSGHLITTRMLFDKVEGFDASLETGEDYALAQTAKSFNAPILNNPSLAVVHVGYPKTLYQFIRREIWHGRGDCKSISAIIKSKVAMMSMMFVLLHFCIFILLFSYPSAVTALAGLFLIGGICIYFAVCRPDADSIKSLVLISLLYYFYFVSRAMSCIPSAGAWQSNRRHSIEGGK